MEPCLGTNKKQRPEKKPVTIDSRRRVYYNPHINYLCDFPPKSKIWGLKYRSWVFVGFL